MIIILDEIRKMIGMQGGNPAAVHDIAEGLVTLKRLMKQNQAAQAPQNTTAPAATEGEEEYVSRKTRKK